MRTRGFVLGSVVLLATVGACTARQTVVAKKTPAKVVPAKPPRIDAVQPARFVLTEGVGAAYDEEGDASPVRVRDLAIVSGKRLVFEGGRIMQVADAPEVLRGFRSLPKRLGGGYVFWSDDRTYHAPTFLDKLAPFVGIGATGGIRPWFDTFVLRTDMGPLEVNPSSLTVRRTELSRFSEMLSFDGKQGIRTDALGHMEASVDGGKTFRPLDFDDGKRYVGPSRGPGNTLLFQRDPSSDWSGARPDRAGTESRVLGPAGTLIPFDAKANEPALLETPVYASPLEEPAMTRRFAPAELEVAMLAGALVPGDQIILLRETTLRVLSAKTGDFIQDIPLALGGQDFGHCQPVTIGVEVFLACTHASGAHLYALKGTPTTAQLAATFPEPGRFVAGLGDRFLFVGRCGSTPPTVRDFFGYGSSNETTESSDTTPNGAQSAAAPPEPPVVTEDVPEKPIDEAAVCIRLSDGTWVERRFEGLKDRQKTLFLPGDDGQVTAVVMDKPDPDDPPLKLPEGARLIRANTSLQELVFYEPEDSSEPKLRTVFRDVWLDEKDGSVHGWELSQPREDDSKEGDDDSELRENISPYSTPTGLLVGVQINSDGTIKKYSVPDGVDKVVVGGPYALARSKADDGATYYESTNGGRWFLPVSSPISADFIESLNAETEGCSITGCSLGGGLVRLGWGSALSLAKLVKEKKEAIDDGADPFARLFDPRKLLPEKQVRIARCHTENAGASTAADSDKPFALTLVQDDKLAMGAVVDRKWTAQSTIPFELKPMFSVQFENVDTDDLDGETIPLLRSTLTNPVGFFLRTKDFRFDLSSGPKRKPIAMASEARGNSAAEVDREAFVLLEPRSGELQLVRGNSSRVLMRISQTPDVNFAHLSLARRAGTGADVFAIALVQPGTGDILLGDLDLGRAAVGPLRRVGNVRKLDDSAPCVHGARDYRMVMNEYLLATIDDAKDPESAGFTASSLVTLGAGEACREASEIKLGDNSTLVVRFASSKGADFPAIVHGRGKSQRATCTFK